MSKTCTTHENVNIIQMLRQAQYDLRTTINFVELASSVVTLSLSKGLIYQ